MDKCVYGCGQKAKFDMKNGKQCCSKHHSACPAIKKKMLGGQQTARQSGVKKFNKNAPAQTDKGTLVFEDLFIDQKKVSTN